MKKRPWIFTIHKTTLIGLHYDSLFLELTIINKNALHYIENMGSGSPCTCNARICNYHKQSGYGFSTGEAVITDAKQQDYLIDSIIKPFMNNDKAASQAALNELRDAIAKSSAVNGLELNQLCVEINKSYNGTKDTFKSATKEGYTAVKPTCGAIIYIIVAIVVFTFIGYLIYRCINCPCRKKREKELQEAEALEYIT